MFLKLLKKEFKRISCLALVFFMVFATVACDNTKVEDESKSESITIVDHLDRTVTIEKIPERIVSGYYIATSYIISLNQQDKLVGIEDKAATRNIYKLAAPEIINLENVGSIKSFNVESCANLKPDLVIMSVRSKDAVKQLETIGINVIAINPESPDLIEDSIKILAKATGSEVQGEKLIKFISENQNEMDEILKDENKKNVYMAGGDNVLNTAGSKMYQHYQLQSAMGINVAGELEDNYWASISYEQLINYNPDILVILPDASYTADDIKNDNNLKNINCVKTDKLYKMPNTIESWDSPVPSHILGVMWYANTLYPDKYTDEMFENNVKDFYKEFFRIEVELDV